MLSEIKQEELDEKKILVNMTIMLYKYIYIEVVRHTYIYYNGNVERREQN